MPIGPTLVSQLMDQNQTAIVGADRILSAEGYDFIGYHGTNGSNMRQMVAYQLSTTKIGTSAGTSSGRGFYVAFTPGLARDFAITAAHRTVSIQTKYGEEEQSVRREGSQGTEVILRVYAYHFLQFQDIADYIWTTMGGGGGQLELIIQEHRFDRLAVIPTILQTDHTLSARVPPASRTLAGGKLERPGRLEAGRYKESPF